ncbi:MAG TPA: MarR family transcriptional regulator [Solirubrobacterales bacterium]|nr:MarR family transcriptional regulator [Solirubrobacterales bacterium]
MNQIRRKRPPAGELQRLAQLLSQAERGVIRQLGRVLEGEGCSVEQWRTLVLLADGATHSMSEIGESALLPPPSLTRLIDRMVAENLAYRKADPADRRRVLVHISRRGQALHGRLAERIERHRDVILAEASTAQLAQLTALLTELGNRPDQSRSAERGATSKEG